MAKFIARSETNDLIVVDSENDSKRLLSLAGTEGVTLYAVRPVGDGNFLLVRQQLVNAVYEPTLTSADLADDVN